MKKAIRVFMVLIICTIFIGIGNEVVNAKTDKVIKIKLVNKKMNVNTSEAIVQVNNKKDKSISISKIVTKKKKQVGLKTADEQVEMKTEENWVEMKRNNKKRKVKAHTKEYVDVNIKGIPAGEYRMIFYMKSGSRVMKRKIHFTVERISEERETTKEQEKITEQETTTEIETTEPQMPTEEETTDYYLPPAGLLPNTSTTKNTTAKTQNISKNSRYYNAKQILLNGDFYIDKKGATKAVIFSETDYKTAYKTKIDLIIQRRTKTGFKTYKRYKQIKNSNVAFMNKNIKIKKSGKYRMFVRIVSYKRQNKRSIRYYKSKIVTYKNG